MNPRPIMALIILLSLGTSSPAQTSVGSAFTYQGQLKTSGSPANGIFNMVFKLFDASAAGNQVGPTLTFDGAGGNPAPVAVANGLFTVQLDFGVGPYTANQARWLESSVNGTTLSPRQPLTPALFALNTRGLNVDATGNVGIGTTAPTTTLHVKGPDEQVRIQGVGVGAPNYAYAAFLDSTGTRIGYVGDASPDATSVFLASDSGDVILGSTVNRALNVKPNGNVGIGTTTPTVKLHVKSDGEALRVQGSGIGAANNAWVGFSDGNGTPTGYVGDADPGNGNMYLTSYTGDVFLGTAAGYILDVKDNGNVGIGTSTPTAKLDVRGDIALGPSGQYRAASGEENLRIIRGHVSSAGSILEGSGFHPFRTDVGRYTIRFDNAFSSYPSVTATAFGEFGLVWIICCSGTTESNAYFQLTDAGDGSFSDDNFWFIAIGPR